MADKVFCDVALDHADLALLQCWKEKVSKGFECSLMLKHSKGRVTTILTSSSLKIPVPRKSKPAPKISAEIITRKKGLSKKRLEALLSYQKRLVEEKGLPPSRLMLEKAAATPPSTPSAESAEASIFKCDLCYYYTHSKHGLSVHRGAKHKNKQKSESSNPVNVKPVEISSETRKTTAQHGNSKTLKCSLCGKTFPNKPDFNEHKAALNVIECNLCHSDSYEVRFSNCARLMEHWQNDHKETQHNWIVKS